MRRLGDINFILEEIVESFDLKSSEIIKIFYYHICKYNKFQEEYLDGSHPILKINNKKIYNKPKEIKKETSNKIKKLLNLYFKEHDLQWGEVIYIIYGYLMIHSDNNDLKTLSYTK